jgi:uncharacterized protein with PQ loop repeat
MAMRISQILGAIGTGLVIGGYLPQVRHLLKEHCSAGLSPVAFALWCSAALLFLTYAVVIHDIVFIAVQCVNLVANGFILMLTRRFEGQLCVLHRGSRVGWPMNPGQPTR